MIKDYSLVEIKSFLQTIQDQVSSILLDPAPNANSHFFQNFTHISLRTFKYLSHYLNLILHDEAVGLDLAQIYENCSRSLEQYRSRNFTLESYASTSYALNENDAKEDDEIYHFMNTRNTNIPLECLGSPQLQQERKELALFVQQMGQKKKVSPKESKRSQHLAQQQLPGIKVLKKAEQDRSLNQTGSEDPANNIGTETLQTNKIIKIDRMRQIEEVQTQTDCLPQEFQAQTQKGEDQVKSQAENCIKSEIVVDFEQPLGEEVQRKGKLVSKSRKGVRAEGKNEHKKKKRAQIASSFKLDQSQAEQYKTWRRGKQDRLEQTSIKAISSRQGIQLSSKQVHITYTNNSFGFILDQIGYAQDKADSSKTVEIRRNEMDVISQAQEDCPELRSDCKFGTPDQSNTIRTKQAGQNTLDKHKTKYSILRKSMLLPMATAHTCKQTEQTLNLEDSQEINDIKNISILQKRLEKVSQNLPAIKGIESVSLESKKERGRISPNICLIELKENGLQSVKSKPTDSKKDPNQSKSIMTQLQQQQQSIQISRLAPIENNTTERYNKLNQRKPKMQNFSRRLHYKLVHSTDYLDKYVNKSVQRLHSKLANLKDAQLEARNSFQKGSLLNINNRHKLTEDTNANEGRQIVQSKQSNKSSKSKVKLINLSKLNHEQAVRKINDGTIKKMLEKSKGLQSSTRSMNQTKFLNYGSTNESQQPSHLKLQPQEKDCRILMNKKIAESCRGRYSQTQLNLFTRQLRKKKKREMIAQYLELIQASHKQFCGQNCVHIQNLHKRVNLDGSMSEEGIVDQLLRLIKKEK